MVVTNHAEKRFKERVKLPKKTQDKVIRKAMDIGITHKECVGSLRRYLDSLFLSHKTAHKMRIFENNVYIFSHDEILITILPLPNKYYKVVNKIKKERKETA